MFEFYDTKRNIQQILDALGGFPSESGWLDYKDATIIPQEPPKGADEPTKRAFKKAKQAFMSDFRKLVVAFLNSLDSFGKPKVIFFGVSENKDANKTTIAGLSGIKFPDDNEWQNSFLKIKPSRPFVETGTVEYRGLKIGYLWIREDNYNGPYYYNEKGKQRYPIRWGGNMGNSDSDSMTPDERREWEEKAKAKSKMFDKTPDIIVAVTVGAYCETNINDKALIIEALGNDRTLREEELEKKFQEFKKRCLEREPALFKEESSLNSRYILYRVQDKATWLSKFSADEAHEALEVIEKAMTSTSKQYSPELLDSVMDTLVELSDNGYRFRVKQLLRSVVMLETFCRRPLWGAQIAEIAPELVLELADGAEFWNASLKAETIQALRAVAWDPEYFERAIELLYKLRKPENSGDDDATAALCNILTCESHGTAADFQQRLDAVREIARRDRPLAFRILKRSLEYSCSGWKSLSPVYFPRKYRRLSNGTYLIKISQYQTYYEELLRNAESAEDILALLPQWLPPFPFSNLYALARRIEELEPSIQNPAEREQIWERLCHAPLLWNIGPSAEPTNLEWDENVEAIVPKKRPQASDGGPTSDDSADTASKTDSKPKNYLLSASLTVRFQEVGRLFRPAVPFADARFWFRRETRGELYLTDNNPNAVDDKVMQKRKDALSEIYSLCGIEEICNFLQSLPDSYERPLDILADFSLTVQDEKFLLDVFSRNSSLRKACEDYFHRKSYSQDLDWLKKLDAGLSGAESKADFYAALYPREEFLSYFEEQLGERADAYWVAVNPLKFWGRIPFVVGQFTYAVGQFMKYQCPKKASEMLCMCQRFDALPSEWLFERLMEPDCMNCFPKDAFCRAYDALSACLDENCLEKLECQFFSLYGADFDFFKPRVTFKRLANEPEIFVKLAKKAALLSDEEKLLRACDAAPDDVKAWADRIESLCVSETPEIRERVGKWGGYILYLTLRDAGDSYALNDDSADLLESSDARREGFFCRAYFPNDAHIQSDAEKRETAKRFEAFAEKQETSGRAKLARAFKDCAKSLIDSVEFR